MTREEAIKLGYDIKREMIDILKQFYHKSESIEQNLKKYNTLFGIPVSREDLEYIISNKIPDLDKVESLNNCIDNILKKPKYGRYYGKSVFEKAKTVTIYGRKCYENKYQYQESVDAPVKRGNKPGFIPQRLTVQQINQIETMYDKTLSIADNWRKYRDVTNVNIVYNHYRGYARKFIGPIYKSKKN